MYSIFYLSIPVSRKFSVSETIFVLYQHHQKILGNVIKQQKQKGVLQGELEVLMANPQRLKEITDALKTQDKGVAKDVLSKNLFVRAGIEKRLAINHGLSQEGKLTNYLNNKLIEVTDYVI